MHTLYVIVPVYNMDRYLRRCVDSVLAQTYGRVKVILVDDGSTDASPGICDAYADAHPNVCVLHQENGGLSQARNAGLRSCWYNPGGLPPRPDIEPDYTIRRLQELPPLLERL